MILLLCTQRIGRSLVGLLKDKLSLTIEYKTLVEILGFLLYGNRQGIHNTVG